jgi:hypothetical protein
MDLERPDRTLQSLTDDEIESCLGGSTDLELVKKLLLENYASDGWITVMDFGYSFAEAIQTFIDAEPDTDEYRKAWDINSEWGESIAQNVNDLLTGDGLLI